MKRKIIIWIAIFSGIFLTSGIYIVVSIEKGTSTLDNLIKLHQVELLREHLLIQLKRVQSDLFFKNTRYAMGAASMVAHVRAMDMTMNECFDCHHSEGITNILTDLSGSIGQYKDAISRVLTIRADVNRLEAEEDVAFNVGNDLQVKVNHMIAIANKNLEVKTKATLKTIDFSKKILFILIAIGPIFAIVLAVTFLRSVTTPISVLLGATRRLKAVDLQYRIKEELNDEFAELATAFNEMANSLEQQCQKMQRAEQLTVYGEMAAGLAHEIKTPLAGIKAAMELFSQESSLSEENRTVLGKVIGEIKRIETLMKELLRYARPSKPHFMSVDFSEFLEKVIGLLSQYPSFSRGGAEKIHIIKDFDTDIPEIETDLMQQQQVFLNLFLNAGDAMPEGGTLTVKTLCDPSADQVQIIVSDTGRGIKEDVMASIFKPFFTTKSKGTGLGLATTKRLVEQHGGTISVRNIHGEGTSFTISLPVKQEVKA